MDWKDYQNEAAAFFLELGCEAEADGIAKGIRADHKVDVLVRFQCFGLEIKWIIECKLWNTRVTKEKVMALLSVVDDVGADRGVLISNAGFQSGALRSARSTNITLTSLDHLKQTASEDLISSALGRLEVEAVGLLQLLDGLYSHEATGRNSWQSKPLPGVDGKSGNAGCCRALRA